MDLLENVRLDPSCPPNEMFLVPPEVSAGLDLMDAAASMKQHGIISEQTYLGVCEEVTEAAVKAAREGRVGVITNLR